MFIMSPDNRRKAQLAWLDSLAQLWVAADDMRRDDLLPPKLVRLVKNSNVLMSKLELTKTHVNGT
jgi:hypothetical protein